MQAIANRLLKAGGTRICYIPAEQFVNEMVSAIGSHTTEAFRGRYRSYDLLLVDDVQFLRGKERTQEEFFHTFNVLYNSGRQIVMTSDRHPRELKGLEDRLVSRFEWGLVAGVDRPEYETRVAILQRKAEEDEVSIGPNVVDLIARCCRSSVRELEGALIKLLAVASLTGREPTVDLARISLAGMAELQEHRPPRPREYPGQGGRRLGRYRQGARFEEQDAQARRPEAGRDVPGARASRSSAGPDRERLRWAVTIPRSSTRSGRSSRVFGPTAPSRRRLKSFGKRWRSRREGGGHRTGSIASAEDRAALRRGKPG